MLDKKNVFLIVCMSCCVGLMFVKIFCLEDNKKNLSSKKEDKKSFLVITKSDSTKKKSKNDLKENLGC